MTHEEFIEKLIEYIKTIDDEDRSSQCLDIMIQCMIWGSFNGFEAIGMAEIAKQQYIDMLETVNDDDDEDDYVDGDEWKRLLKK